MEAVEHLTLEDMTKEAGAKTLWDLLRQRFPEKESKHQGGVGEVFGLRARDCESMQQWASRLDEVFSKWRRKVVGGIFQRGPGG